MYRNKDHVAFRHLSLKPTKQSSKQGIGKRFLSENLRAADWLLLAFTAFTRLTGDGFYIDNERGKVQVTIRTEGIFTSLSIFKNDIVVLAQMKPNWRSVDIEKMINGYFAGDDVAAGCRVRVHNILPVPLKLELRCK